MRVRQMRLPFVMRSVRQLVVFDGTDGDSTGSMEFDVWLPTRFSAGVFAGAASPRRDPMHSKPQPGSGPPISGHPVWARFHSAEETRCTRSVQRACCHPRTDGSGTDK